jgi:putative hydrolase of the HAD superfamily
MPITTVIFDYGCVLSHAPTPEDFELLRQAARVEAAAFEETYWRYRDPFDVGALDASAYWQEFGREVGAKFSPAQIKRLAALDCQMWGRTNLVMVEWVRLLRGRGVKTAIISNMSRTIGDYIRRAALWLGLFNQVCFSGEMKILKPDAAIFHACLEALGEPAARTLFIDDREANVAAARALGMHGIVFSSEHQLRPDLEPYGLAESLAEAQARAG